MAERLSESIPHKVVSERVLEEEIDESLGGMFKLTGSNYSLWKSKMRDMLVVKDLWLPVQFGDEKPDKIDAAVWDVMHMKTTAYIRCFIDMSLYNNFNEESKAHELWEKIGIMFQNKMPRIRFRYSGS